MRYRATAEWKRSNRERDRVGFQRIQTRRPAADSRGSVARTCPVTTTRRYDSYTCF